MFKLLLLHVFFCVCLQEKVLADETCKEYRSGESGTIKTKGFPVKYSSESDCLWLITVKPGSYVSLEFGLFDVEGEGSTCIDIVEIKDGQDANAPLIGGYCNIRRPPSVITSSSNYLRIWFKSDKTENLRGFNASYKAVKEPGCGPSDLVRSEGTLKTPRFPSFYPNNINCEWYITVPEGSFVRLTFLGYGMSCEDSLEVWDWRKDIMTSHGKFCVTLPQLIVSKSNKMKIKFTSNEDGRYRGFQAFFTTSLTPGCGGDLSGQRGTILSPNHPYVYPAYSNCVWRLRVPEDRYISLRFSQFMIADKSKKCLYDAVEVREGYSRNSPLIGRFCNLNIPSIISIEGRELFVQFSTGPGQVQGFFKATFLAHKSGCRESLGLADGDSRITNNQLSASSYNSIVLINNQVVKFLPQYGRLYSSFAWCSQPQQSGRIDEFFQITFGSVMVITALATQGHFFRSIGHTAYVEKYFLKYRYTGNTYWIPYVDKSVYNSAVSYKVINANNDTDSVVRNDLLPSIFATDIKIYPISWYSNLASPTICLRAELYGCEYSLGCGRTFSADTAGMISSRDSTASGSRCSWLSIPSPIIPVNLHYAFIMTFTYFDVQCEGKLTITNRITSEQEEYCGNDKPDVLITRPSDQIKIDKRTSSSSSTVGFNVKYGKEFLGSCGNLVDVRDEMGNLTSPSYPDKYGQDRNCTWILMARKGYRVQLQFKVFLLQAKNGTKCLDFLEIKDGPLGSSDLINRYCGNGIPQSVISSSRYLRVSFASDGKFDEAGFVATYADIEPVAAAEVGARSGGLRSSAIAFIVIFVIIIILLVVDFACCHFNKCGITYMLIEKEKRVEKYQRADSDENKNNPMTLGTSVTETAEAETETVDLLVPEAEPVININVEQPTDQSQLPAIEASEIQEEDANKDVTDDLPEAQSEEAQNEETSKEEKRVSFNDTVEFSGDAEENTEEKFDSAPSSPNLSIQRHEKTEEESAEKPKKPSNLDIV